jgi:hypothetical protein
VLANPRSVADTNALRAGGASSSTVSKASYDSRVGRETVTVREGVVDAVELGGEEDLEGSETEGRHAKSSMEGSVGESCQSGQRCDEEHTLTDMIRPVTHLGHSRRVVCHGSRLRCPAEGDVTGPVMAGANQLTHSLRLHSYTERHVPINYKHCRSIALRS